MSNRNINPIMQAMLAPVNPDGLLLTRTVLGGGFAQLGMGNASQATAKVFTCRVCGSQVATDTGNPPIRWPEADRCHNCKEAA